MNFKGCGEYFYPQPPAEWNFENMKKAQAISNPMKAWGIFYKTISALSLLFVIYKVFKKGFSALAIRSVLATAITSIALFAIGHYFRKVAARHVEGLTEEKALAIKLEEFKARLERLPICRTREELEAKLAQDPDFKKQAKSICSDVGSIDCCYDPVKELQPRFEIGIPLTMDQKLDLLDYAYEKRIIFEFKDYQIPVLSEKFPKFNTLILKRNMALQPIREPKRLFFVSLILSVGV